MKIILLLERTDKELNNDSRVLRSIRELTSLGHNVSIVLTNCRNTENSSFNIDGIKIKYTNTLFYFIPDSVNPRLPKVVDFFLLRIIRHCLKPFANKLISLRIAKMFTEDCIDVCWANDFETLDYAIELKKQTNCLIVYDSHEYWSGRTGLTDKKYAFYLRFKEKYIIKKYVNVIISVNQEILEMLKSGKKPLYCLYNIPSTKEFSPIKSYFHKHFNLDKSKKILLYQGGLAEGRGIRFILDAVKEFPPDWVVVFMGSGVLEPFIKKQALVEATQKIFLHPYVPAEELLNYTSAANIGLCTIESISISYQYALPNKFWEYLQAGVPIVSTKLPSMSSIQTTYNIGEEFDEGNQEKFIIAIKSSLEKYEYYNKQIKKAQKAFNYESNVVLTYKKISDTLNHML